ncbi:MAG: cytochrome P450, partial [Micrococcus sp.]|nr:cytochrome P450 [Micrococcus sp.]
MAAEADALVGRLRDGRIHDLSELALHFSTRVAARVVGLTESDQEGLARRLVAFFDQPDAVLGEPSTGWRRITALAASLPGALDLLRFHLADVRPAIRARRAHRRDDVVSHLLDEGCSDLEVLMECVTYGAAGMVTTREFLQMAAWHL